MDLFVFRPWIQGVCRVHTQTFRLMHTLGVGHGEGGVKMSFPRMDAGRKLWSWKCLMPRLLWRVIDGVAMAPHGAQGLLPAVACSMGEAGMWSARANESLTAWMGFLSSYNGNVHSETSWARLFLCLSSLSFFLPASQVVFNEDFLFYVPYTLLHTSHIHISAFIRKKI